MPENSTCLKCTDYVENCLTCVSLGFCTLVYFILVFNTFSAKIYIFYLLKLAIALKVVNQLIQVKL